MIEPIADGEFDVPAPGDGAEAGAGDSTDWSFDAADALPTGIADDDFIEMERKRQDELRLQRERERELEQRMEDDGRQRRQNVRVTVKMPITVQIPGYPDTSARSRDLSATGVGFATRLPLEIETRGSVTVHFPGWDFTKAFVVRFVKPILSGRQVGVQYDELSDDEHESVVKQVFAVQRSQLQAQRKRP